MLGRLCKTGVGRRIGLVERIRPGLLLILLGYGRLFLVILVILAGTRLVVGGRLRILIRLGSRRPLLGIQFMMSLGL